MSKFPADHPMAVLEKVSMFCLVINTRSYGALSLSTSRASKPKLEMATRWTVKWSTWTRLLDTGEWRYRGLRYTHLVWTVCWQALLNSVENALLECRLMREHFNFHVWNWSRFKSQILDFSLLARDYVTSCLSPVLNAFVALYWGFHLQSCLVSARYACLVTRLK